MKKTICRLLVFIMILGSASFDRSGLFVKEAHASTLGSSEFQYHQSDSLGGVPMRLVQNSRIKEETVFSWPASTSDGMTSGSVYTFTYAYRDGYEVQVHFKLGGVSGVIEVYYQMIDAGGAKVLFKKITGGYEGIRQYASGEAEKITDTNIMDDLDLSDPKAVKYTLSDTGSFQFSIYDEATSSDIDMVKILWSGGRIYYATNQAKQGPNIYPFTLKGAMDGSPGYSSLNYDYPKLIDEEGNIGKTFAVSTGYNLSVNGGNVDVTPGADYETRSTQKDYLDYVTLDGNGENKEVAPATNPSLTFEFDIPKKWNKTTRMFEPVKYDASDDTKNDFVKVEFTNLGDRYINIIENVCEDVPYTAASGIEYDFIESTKKGRLTVTSLPGKSLPPSTMYNNLTVSISPQANAKRGPYGPVSSQPTQMSYNRVQGDPSGFTDFGSQYNVRTYLKYSFIQEDITTCTVKLDTPYKWFTDSVNNIFGTYRLYRSTSMGTGGTAIATVNVSQGINDKSQTINIPLNFTDTSGLGDFYWIEFEAAVSGTTTYKLTSQTSYWKPETDVDTLQTPSDFEISDSKTIVVEDSAYEQNYVRFKLSFNIGLHEILYNMTQSKGVQEINYLVKYSDIPSDIASNLKELFTLVVPLDADPAEPVDADKITIINTDGFDGIKILDASYTTTPRRVDGVYRDYGIIEAVILVPVKARVNPQTHFSTNIVFPNVYYASVSGEYKYDVAGVTVPVVTLGASNEDDMNVNAPVSLAVPAPAGIKAQNATTNSFSISWNISRTELFEYMDYILNPKLRTLSGLLNYPAGADSSEVSVKYALYIGNNSEAIQKLAKMTVPSAEGSSPPNDGFVTIDGSVSGGYVTYNSHGNVTINFAALPNDAQQKLREGEIFLIENLEQTDFSPEYQYRTGAAIPSFEAEITGLDDNSPYYALALTSLVPYKTSWSAAKGIGVPETEPSDSSTIAKTDETMHVAIEDAAYNENVLSTFTPVVTVTTTVDVDDPSPDEYEPPAPTGVGHRNDDSTSSDIYWTSIEYLPQPTATGSYEVQYQVFRVAEQVLPDNFLLNKGSLNDIKAFMQSGYPSIEYAAWQTETPVPTALPEYMGYVKGMPDVPYNIAGTEHILSDITLSPGRMYVYYVRSVLVYSTTDANGNAVRSAVKYSVWTPTSVTTSPLDGPINLKQFRSGTYDKYTEAFISFDAPALMSQIQNGDYTLVYQIKADTGDWSAETPMNSTVTGGVDAIADPVGYYSYQYKLTGLEAGSSYLVRVRIIDNNTLDKSVWSNTAPVRTEVNPNEPEDPAPKWLDYYKEKLLEILKQPYWAVNDKTGVSFAGVYRTSMFDGVIGSFPDGMIALGKDARKQDYYIPADAFAKAVAAKAGFKVTADNVTAVIPAGVIDSQQTQALKDIIANKNNNKIRDYFVQLTLSLDSTGETINGNAALTDRINFTIKTIGFTESERVWDTEMEAELKLIANDSAHLSKVNTRLTNALNNGYSNQEMVLLVDTIVAETEQDFIDKVNKSFNSTRLYEYEAQQFAQPIRLSAVPRQQAGATSISGYRRAQNSWQALPTTPYLGGRSIMPVNPGSFIFSGTTVYIPGIENMPGGEAITNLVIKYGLDDFFGKGSSFTTVIPLTNDALIGSVARMAGAGNTQDASAYLRGKGVTVSTRNAYSPANNETTIYMLMSLYELKTNTKVSSIRITNQNIIKGITGINQNYVQHYKAAYHLGIMDKNYMPKEQMPVKDFLQILGKLAGKINL